MIEGEWQDLAKGLIKAELAKRNINFIELSERLRQHGIEETPANLSNKIGRGKFSAVFLLQVLDVIGCEQLNLKI